MKILRRLCMPLLFVGFFSFAMAVESGMYRLLSISTSEKLILISKIPGKNKYLLDASSAKISLDGKPSEFKELKIFSVIQVKFQARKSSRKGINIDGSAIEINISEAGATR